MLWGSRWCSMFEELLERVPFVVVLLRLLARSSRSLCPLDHSIPLSVNVTGRLFPRDRISFSGWFWPSPTPPSPSLPVADFSASFEDVCERAIFMMSSSSLFVTWRSGDFLG